MQVMSWPHFLKTFPPKIDYDVCSNYGNWLYSAGIGNDPRENRKFNMIKQGLDYDNNVSLIWHCCHVVMVMRQAEMSGKWDFH